MKRISTSFLPNLLQRFRQSEEGAVGLVLALFCAFLLLGIGALVIDRKRDFGLDTELEAKMQANATVLANAFEKTANKALLAQKSGHIDQAQDNADQAQEVFRSPISSYTNEQSYIPEMEEYLNTLLNQGEGRLKFRNARAVNVEITCPHGRYLLNFRAQAEQFGTFISSQGRQINVNVSRLTDVKCSANYNYVESPSCAGQGLNCTPTPVQGALCTHNNPKGTDGFISQNANNVDEAVTRSNVNFVFSLDADSRANLGDDTVRRFASAMWSAASNSNAGIRVSGGLTLGNFPMGGGGAPTCASTGSPLEANSGSCYDNVTGFPDASGGPGTTGLANVNRKGGFAGELRAQTTRRCPAGQAVWAYRAVPAGTCYEQASYDVPNVVAPDYAYQSAIDDGSANKDYGDNNDLVQVCRNGGQGSTVDVQTHYVIDDGSATDQSKCSGKPGSGDCRQVRYVTNCIVEKAGQNQKTVYKGVWRGVCRSENLGTTAAEMYTSPDRLLRFQAELVADLDGKKVSNATPKVTLSAAPTVGLGDAMRTVDAETLNQVHELDNLHLKNTERAIPFACDSGPVDESTGKMVDNGGNLTAPYGTRVNGDPLFHDFDNLGDRSLVDVSGNSTGLAAAANDHKGCRVPSLPNVSGKMTDTVASYDLAFTRDGCAGPLCDIPEGMYAITMRATRTLDTNIAPNNLSDKPDGGLTTRWKAPDGNRWAWQEIANVSAVGGECPRQPDGCKEWIIGANGRYCKEYRYDTVQWLNRTGGTGPQSGKCGNGEDDAGNPCHNIASYILQNSDDKAATPAPERLNVGAVAMERRMIEVNNRATPYQCTVDKGETATGSRSSVVKIARNNALNCDWQHGAGFFCATQGNGVSGDQVEQPFIDLNDGGGIFSLTGDNFTGPILLGDDKEQFGTPTRRTNYAARRITDGRLTVDADNSFTIMPTQVEALESVHFRNSDYAPDNIPIENSAARFKAAMDAMARGYSGYDILPMHRGNQCALIRQGARALMASEQLNPGGLSKFLVYVGAWPTPTVLTPGILPPESFANHAMPGGPPGRYDATNLKLADTPTYTTDTDVMAKMIKSCIGMADNNTTITPFVITAIPANAGKPEAQAMINALEAATTHTTNEACRHPYCLISDQERKWGLENVMTPETCAGRLWRCLNPPSTR